MASWTDQVESELAELSSLYSRWAQSQELLEAHGYGGKTALEVLDEPDGRGATWLRERENAARWIRFRLWKVYRLTGHCAFPDIPWLELAPRTGQIVEAYRSFIATHAGRPLHEVWRDQIAKNIELIAGSYGWCAFTVLQRTIGFDRQFGLSIHEVGELNFLERHEREQIRDAMKDWYQHHERELGWTESLQIFTYMGTGLPLMMPQVVVDAVERGMQEWRIGGPGLKRQGGRSVHQRPSP